MFQVGIRLRSLCVYFCVQIWWSNDSHISLCVYLEQFSTDGIAVGLSMDVDFMSFRTGLHVLSRTSSCTW